MQINSIHDLIFINFGFNYFQFFILFLFYIFHYYSRELHFIIHIRRRVIE